MISGHPTRKFKFQIWLALTEVHSTNSRYQFDKTERMFIILIEMAAAILFAIALSKNQHCIRIEVQTLCVVKSSLRKNHYYEPVFPSSSNTFALLIKRISDKDICAISDHGDSWCLWTRNAATLKFPRKKYLDGA